MVLACCYGTRPEFIKIAPVVLALRRQFPTVGVKVICSGQHQELLGGLGEIFGVGTDVDLDVRRQVGNKADLSVLIGGLLPKFSKAISSLSPAGVLVQGDTASTFSAALASFHLEVPVYYVEAGLRTYDLGQPFPEEGYRQMVSRIAAVCLAPTERNKRNLIAERVSPKAVRVVGNTVVDAVELVKKYLTEGKAEELLSKELPELKRKKFERLVLVTVHRRENQGQPMRQILAAVVELAKKNPKVLFVVPMHPNPDVCKVVKAKLGGIKGVLLTKPLKYTAFLAVLSLAWVVLTDSGGVQEEAPVFGVPVVVLRQKTERQEGVRTGWSKLAGVETDKIIESVKSLAGWKPPAGGNPYGDGKASERIARLIYDSFQ